MRQRRWRTRVRAAHCHRCHRLFYFNQRRDPHVLLAAATRFNFITSILYTHIYLYSVCIGLRRTRGNNILERSAFAKIPPPAPPFTAGPFHPSIHLYGRSAVLGRRKALLLLLFAYFVNTLFHHYR